MIFGCQLGFTSYFCVVLSVTHFVLAGRHWIKLEDKVMDIHSFVDSVGIKSVFSVLFMCYMCNLMYITDQKKFAVLKLSEEVSSTLRI